MQTVHCCICVHMHACKLMHLCMHINESFSLNNKKRNEVIRKTLGLACITDKIREARLRWRGHVMRREDQNSMIRIMTAEVNGRQTTDARRSHGRHRTARHEVYPIKVRAYC